MSLFAPMDVRGPDQRRKQLMQKLAQQGRRAVPMPGHAGQAAGGAGVGRPFRGASTFRPPSTHGGNVMQSILARLGVGGQPGQGEFSGGPGSPISHGGMPSQDPYSRAPSPVQGGTPIGPNDPTMPAPPGMGHNPVLGSGGGYNDAPNGAPVAGYGGGGASIDSGPLASHGFDIPDPGATRSPGLVPLGNGMFYDPRSDQVVNQSQPSGGGGSVYRR